MGDSPEASTIHQDGVWIWTIRSAVGLTAIWAAAVVYLAFGSTTPVSTLTLNEVGDFLAGIAGPPAFLWLILGFFQQGRELRIQAEELRQSVEQFKIQSAHMGSDVQHAVMLERKNQARRLFDSRIKRLSHVLEPLYQNPLIGDHRSSSAIRLYDARPSYITSVGEGHDLKKEIAEEIGRLTRLEQQHPGIWAKLASAQSKELKDLPNRAIEFARFISKLEHEASACELSDILFELRRDRIKVLGRILIRIAEHVDGASVPQELRDASAAVDAT